MYRSLVMLVVIIALTAISSAAQASLQPTTSASQPQIVNSVLPETLPKPSHSVPGMYEIGSRRSISSTAPAAPATSNSGITIAAPVSAVCTIVVDGRRVIAVYSNSHSADWADALFVVRNKSINGPTQKMNRAFWDSARMVATEQAMPYGFLSKDNS